MKNEKLKPKQRWTGLYRETEIADFTVRCDESMKRSKLRSKNFKCRNNCRNCICGIVKVVGYDYERHGHFNTKNDRHVPSLR